MNIIHLPRRTIARLLRWVDDRLPLRLLTGSGPLTAAYFYLKGVYRFEQRALLMGLATYRQDIRAGDPYYRLRRNTHRLEKGLSSADRRELFAESYIEETVDAFRRVASNREGHANDPSLIWARDVLSQYFDSVGSSAAIDRAKEQFWSDRKDDPSPVKCAPYEYVLREPAVELSALRSLAEQRVSLRSFAGRRVDRTLLDAAVDVGMQSPSACNRLPYEFRFYDDDDIRPRLAELAPGMNGWGHDSPVICALVGKYRAYFHPRDRHAIYVDAALAAAPFQLALVALGLGSCAVNWPQLRRLDEAITRLLNLDPDEKVVMLMAIGHPSPRAVVPYSAKKAMEEVRSFNKL